MSAYILAANTETTPPGETTRKIHVIDAENPARTTAVLRGEPFQNRALCGTLWWTSPEEYPSLFLTAQEKDSRKGLCSRCSVALATTRT